LPASRPGLARVDAVVFHSACGIRALTVIPAELEAARRVLQIDDDSREKDPDGTVYFRGAVRSERAHRDHAIALTCSVAKGSDTASSDIDVLIVSDHLSLEEAFALFEPAEARLGRKISPTIYTSEELPRRRRERQPFLTRVLGDKHHVLLGSADATGLPGLRKPRTLAPAGRPTGK
jgi:predicted nucleotidyltransferase